MDVVVVVVVVAAVVVAVVVTGVDAFCGGTRPVPVPVPLAFPVTWFGVAGACSPSDWFSRFDVDICGLLECKIFVKPPPANDPFGESPVTTTDGARTRRGLNIAGISLSRVIFFYLYSFALLSISNHPAKIRLRPQRCNLAFLHFGATHRFGSVKEKVCKNWFRLMMAAIRSCDERKESKRAISRIFLDSVANGIREEMLKIDMT